MRTTPQLGVADLDNEHELLHRAIVILRDCDPGDTKDALGSLRACAQSHFAGEDEDLRAMKDGNASCHLDEHAAVLKSLEEVAHALDDSLISEVNKARLVRRLTDELLRWLPEHVSEMDSAVAKRRATDRFGGAPVQFIRTR